MNAKRTTAVIVGGGEPPSMSLFAEAITADPRPLVLCADGGANLCRRYDCVPDYIVGDLDSAREEAKRVIAGERVISIDEQETTDLQKALNFAEGIQVLEATLLGCTGGRSDHTLWNLSLLPTFCGRISLRLLDDYCELRLIAGRSSIRFRADIGQKISLCPLDGPAREVTTSGLRWPLQHQDLIPGKVNGISNEVRSNPVEIEVGEGNLLLCVQRESASGRIDLLG